MKIFVEDGATNPSNIGSYKNTRNCEPVIPQSMQSEKPIRGSYSKWHRRKTESKVSNDFKSTLKLWNMSLDMLRDLIYNWILDEYDIEFAVDNDVLSVKELEDNESTIYEVVDNIIVYLESYYEDGEEDPRTFDEVIKRMPDCVDMLKKLQHSFDSLKQEQEKDWDELVESINEEE